MRLTNILKVLAVTVGFGLLTACEIDSTDAECEATTMDQVHANFRVEIYVTRPDYTPVDGAYVQAFLKKRPCGEDFKGHAEFSGYTQAGLYESGLAGYNFHNQDDLVSAEVHVHHSSGTYIAEFTMKGSEIIPYNGQTKTIIMDDFNNYPD